VTIALLCKFTFTITITICEQFLHFIAYPLITANVVPLDRDNITILFLHFCYFSTGHAACSNMGPDFQKILGKILSLA